MNKVREHWGSKFGFIMAALGSAVGLGILWKFPYTVGENGGGLFILTYLVCVIIVGIPIFISELVIGRSTQRASVGAYETLDKKRTGWKAVGWFGVLASFLIMSFYSVIAGWGMSYIVQSLTGFYQGLSAEEINQVFVTLSDSGGVTLFWHFIFTLITMGIVLSGVRKGLEFWAKHMTRMLLILLIGFFIYGMTMDGFGAAFRFVFYPDFSSFKLSSALEALGLAFWTLSIGQGIMISFGSYMKKSINIPQMAGIVGGSVIVVSLLAALSIFPVVFTFDLEPQAGYGLVFKTLPFLFAKLPASLLISTAFFTLFVFTALTSAIPLIEVVATNLMELYEISRKRAVLFVGCGTFLFGIPSAYAAAGGVFPEWSSIYGTDFLETINSLVSIWIIPIGGLLSAVFVGWYMDKKIAQDEFMSGNKCRWIFKPWMFFMRWIVPLTILLIIIQKSGLFNFDVLINRGSYESS